MTSPTTDRPTDDPALLAEGFVFRYPTGDGPALRDVSFEVARGDVLGVLGPVEAGKTTLAMAMASFAPQNTGGTTSGDLRVAGRDPREATDTDVAMVFEDYSAQLTQVRVLDEVVAPLVNRGVPRPEAVDRAHDLLERVRMGDATGQYTWELSGGQQQRLAIAAALAVDPEVLLFDTATDMLDPAGRDEVASLVASLAGEKTLVVTENDPDALVGVADDLLVLDGGRPVAFGPADSLLRDHDLLEDVGVRSPVCCRTARRTGVSGSPLTPGEFVDELPSAAATPDPGPNPGHLAPSATDGGTETVGGDVLLRADDVTYGYDGGDPAVDGVDLAVREGEVHAVVGGNGAGKTTLTKLLVGLFEPDEGSVIVDGDPLGGDPAREVAESVGIALQNPDEQLSEQTVEAELRFPLEQRRYEREGLLGLSKRERYDESFVGRRVEAVRELVGIPESELDADPMFLPRGRRRRVAVGAALAPDPDVLVLDEPAAGVDARARETVVELVERLRDRGKGVVLVDHEMDFVCELADTVTVLEDGAVAMQGPTREVFATDNWEWLASRHMRPPRVARLARRVGVDALTEDEFVASLDRRSEVTE